MNIFCDGGFGYWKLLANNQRVKFRNIFGEYQPSLIEGDIDLSIKIDGFGSWTFGEAARLRSSQVGNIQESRWIFSDEYLAGLLLAISEAYSANTHHIKASILTGLPGQDYKDKRVIEEFKSSLLGEYTIHRNNYKQTITIENVTVTSQAYGPLFNHLINGNGQFNRPDTKARFARFGSINIGFNTVEIDTVSIGNLDNPNLQSTKQWKSTPSGVHTLIENMRQYLQEQFLGERFNDNRVIETIEENGLELYGKWYGVEAKEIKAEFASNIKRLASNVYGDDLKDLTWLILTGGGATIVADYFSDYHQQIKVSNDPQWDAVEGYKKAGRVYGK